jgi:acetyl-CoA C-acetyltransferase
MSNDPIVIVSAKRTPMGAFHGEVANFTAPELGSLVIKAVLNETGVHCSDIDEVIMGCVLPAGLKQAPARQAALGAGLAQKVECCTVNKVCGSGLKSVMMAADQLRLAYSDIIIAGGMECMSNAPYMLPHARFGYRYGHGKVLDHMALDGLEDAYAGVAMGVYGDDTAEKYGFTREQQDAFAIRSCERAIAATEKGLFKDEIVPLTVKTKQGELVIEKDEPLAKFNPEKIPKLKPAFKEGGTVTAANSSPITDGAAVLMLMTKSEAEKRGLKPMATIKGYTSYSHAPEWFTTAPVGALSKLSQAIDWDLKKVDLFEINEAFASVTMAAIEEHKLDDERVNVHGGACALGHPIGASGARLAVTLLHAMEQQDAKKGIVTLCIGGGEAVAMAFERP